MFEVQASVCDLFLDSAEVFISSPPLIVSDLALHLVHLLPSVDGGKPPSESRSAVLTSRNCQALASVVRSMPSHTSFPSS